MGQPSSTSSSKQVRALLLALGLVLAIETVVFATIARQAPIAEGSRFYAAGTQPTFAESLVHWQTARIEQTGDTDVVFVGDSSCTIGVIPEIIHRLTGRRAQNLCLIVDVGVRGHTAMLERYIAVKGAPQTVIFYFSADLLAKDESIFEQGGLRAAYLSWLGHDGGVASRLPSTRLRTAARRFIGGQWYGEIPTENALRAFLDKYSGYLRDPRKARGKSYRTPPLAMGEEGLLRLEGLVRLTERERIKLVLMPAPFPASHDKKETRRTLQQNEALLRALTESFSHVSLAWPPLYTLPDERFLDFQHLTVDGAKQNTFNISGWLRKENPVP